MCGRTKTVEAKSGIRQFCSRACWGKSLNIKREKALQPVGYERIKDIDDDGLTNLVLAIVAQAKADVLMFSPKNEIRQDAEEFFLGGYFDAMTGLDGYDVLCRLTDEYEEKQRMKKIRRHW
jgi:hypothetical protein